MAVFAICLFVSVVLYLLYEWATFKYNTFEERGVPYDPPQPLVGNLGPVMRKQQSFMRLFLDFYRRNKANKIAGFYQFRDPVYVLFDPELIKKVTVKDFDHFPNHCPTVRTKGDPLLTNLMTAMKDQRWKDMRSTLSPVFTASKMRAMFTLMNECFEQSLNYLHKQSHNGQGFQFELKECFTRLSNDIIASTAFGLKMNSYEDRDSKFYRIGQTLMKFKGKQLIRSMLATTAPKLMDLFGFRVFSADKTDYFMQLVIDGMKYREQHNIVRPDMIQLLMEAKRESTRHWTDEEIVAQCFLFFFAAFENNANLICLSCHELMLNSVIQQRLYVEVAEMSAHLNGAPIDYDNLGKLTYLEMVLSETLRKWPLGQFTDRVCTKQYKLTDDEGNLVFDFKPGDRIFLPIIGLHRDEEYFERPDLFDPERFSEENKDSIKPFTYLPFGAGPRNCIGNRYAIMQAKAMIYYIVLNFKIEASAKTVKDLEEDVIGFKITPKSGFWMRFVPRK